MGTSVDPTVEMELYVRELQQLLGAVCRRIEGLDAAQMNYRPQLPESNSLYAIATHVLGNSEAWVLGIICGQAVGRDRAAEFQTSGEDGRALIARAQSMAETFGAALRALPPGVLDEKRTPRPPLLGIGPGEELTVREGLMRVLLHGRLHIGHMELTRDMALNAKSGAA